MSIIRELPKLIIDWSNDEAVVRAAVPDAEIWGTRHGKVCVQGPLGPMGYWTGYGTRERRRAEAWTSARMVDPTVIAFEHLHNPCLKGTSK